MVGFLLADEYNCPWAEISSPFTLEAVGARLGREVRSTQGVSKTKGKVNIKVLFQGRQGGTVGEVSTYGSGHDPGVLGWSLVSGSLLSREFASFSLSLCSSPLLVLSLSQVNSL